MRWLWTKFSVFALAIVVPAVIVAVLGYVSLRQWERSAELLFREQARDVASMAAEKIEMLLRQSDDELLARLLTIVEGGEHGDAVTTAHHRGQHRALARDHVTPTAALP